MKSLKKTEKEDLKNIIINLKDKLNVKTVKFYQRFLRWYLFFVNNFNMKK